MLDFHERRRLRSILFSKVSILVVCALAVFLGLSAYERYEAARETAEKRAERAVELERLKMRAAALEAQVEYIESDYGREAELRRQYDVARPDEKVVVIVGDAPASATSLASSAAEPPPPVPLWKRVLLFWR